MFRNLTFTQSYQICQGLYNDITDASATLANLNSTSQDHSKMGQILFLSVTSQKQHMSLNSTNSLRGQITWDTCKLFMQMDNDTN